MWEFAKGDVRHEDGLGHEVLQTVYAFEGVASVFVSDDDKLEMRNVSVDIRKSTDSCSVYILKQGGRYREMADDIQHVNERLQACKQLTPVRNQCDAAHCRSQRRPIVCLDHLVLLHNRLA